MDAMTDDSPEASTTLEFKKAREYRDGVWVQISPPVPSEPDADWDEAVKEAGYEEFFSSGEASSNSLAVTVYRGPSSFLIGLDSTSMYDAVYAATLPDVIDLLSKWMPVVNAIGFGHLLAEVDEGSRSLAAGIRKALSLT